MNELCLRLLPERLAICRLPPGIGSPDWARGSFVSITRTSDEVSVVCDESFVPESVRKETGFRCLQVIGPLSFDLVGILAELCGALAGEGIPVFVASTFETDYLMVRSAALQGARGALLVRGVEIEG